MVRPLSCSFGRKVGASTGNLSLGRRSLGTATQARVAARTDVEIATRTSMKRGRAKKWGRREISEEEEG